MVELITTDTSSGRRIDSLCIKCSIADVDNHLQRILTDCLEQNDLDASTVCIEVEFDVEIDHQPATGPYLT